MLTTLATTNTLLCKKKAGLSPKGVSEKPDYQNRM